VASVAVPVALLWLPTAQMSAAPRALMPLSTLPVVAGPLTSDQPLAVLCSIKVWRLESANMARPTAHTSVGERSATAFRPVV
jgi:hypothetical protein